MQNYIICTFMILGTSGLVVVPHVSRAMEVCPCIRVCLSVSVCGCTRLCLYAKYVLVCDYFCETILVCSCVSIDIYVCVTFHVCVFVCILQQPNPYVPLFTVLSSLSSSPLAFGLKQRTDHAPKDRGTPSR